MSLFILMNQAMAGTASTRVRRQIHDSKRDGKAMAKR